MADDAVAWARDALNSGHAPSAVIAELVGSGYDRNVAEQVVSEAQSNRHGNDGRMPHLSRRILGISAAIVLLIAAVGAGPPVMKSISAVFAGPANETAGRNGLNTAEPVTFASLVEHTGTYRVHYRISGGHPLAKGNLSVTRGPEWTRKTLTTISPLGDRQRATAYQSPGAEATVYCGDILQSLLQSDTEAPACSHTSLYTFIFPTMLTSARPLADNLDEIDVTALGHDTVNGRDCEQFDVRFDFIHLYDTLLTETQQETAETTNETLSPQHARLCLDPENGYALRSVLRDQQPRNGSTTTDTGSITDPDNITLMAVNVSTDITAETVEPPVDSVLTVECPDNATDTGVAQLTTFTAAGTNATFTVNGDNRSVDLTVGEITRIEITADDLADWENTFALYAGEKATTTCYYTS